MYGGLLDQVEELQGALKDYALNIPGLADELRSGIVEFADVANQALRSLTKGQEQLEKLIYADEVADPKKKPEDHLKPENDLKEKHPGVIKDLKEKLRQWQSSLPARPSGKVFSNLRKARK